MIWHPTPTTHRTWVLRQLKLRNRNDVFTDFTLIVRSLTLAFNLLSHLIVMLSFKDKRLITSATLLKPHPWAASLGYYDLIFITNSAVL